LNQESKAQKSMVTEIQEDADKTEIEGNEKTAFELLRQTVSVSAEDKESQEASFKAWFALCETKIMEIVQNSKANTTQILTKMYRTHYNSLDQLFEIQNSFLVDLNEKDNRTNLARDFLSKYNIFLDEFSEMVS